MFGSSFAGSLSAPCAWVMDRTSIQWPSTMMVTSVASSSQSGMPRKPSVTAALNTKATVMMPMLVHGRPRCRCYERRLREDQWVAAIRHPFWRAYQHHQPGAGGTDCAAAEAAFRGAGCSAGTRTHQPAVMPSNRAMADSLSAEQGTDYDMAFRMHTIATTARASR